MRQAPPCQSNTTDVRIITEKRNCADRAIGND
jgi:hypothetical protein